MGRADYSKETFILTSAIGEAALRWVEQEYQENHQAAQVVREMPPKDPVRYTAANDRIRVLVVDDDDDIREIVAEHLKEQGYAVIQAATGQSAYDIVRADQNFNIVVSEVVMPGMDGVTLAGLLRSHMPNLPVVFITGYSRAYDLSGEMVLAKPFTGAALASLVAKGLGRAA
jgi:CheY-like chemotaxis protein